MAKNLSVPTFGLSKSSQLPAGSATKTRFLAAIVFGLATTVLAASANAATVTAYFSGSGIITGPGPHTGAIVFGGSFSYNTNWTDSNPDPRTGIYDTTGVPYSFGMTWTYLDNSTFDPGIGFYSGWNIVVRDQPTGGTFPDVFGASGSLNAAPLVSALAEASLFDFNGSTPDPTSILKNDLLFIPSFAQFGNFGYADVNRQCAAPCSEVHWVGDISYFSITVTPLPASLWLFASGLGALGLWSARRAPV